MKYFAVVKSLFHRKVLMPSWSPYSAVKSLCCRKVRMMSWSPYAVMKSLSPYAVVKPFCRPKVLLLSRCPYDVAVFSCCRARGIKNTKLRAMLRAIRTKGSGWDGMSAAVLRQCVSSWNTLLSSKSLRALYRVFLVFWYRDVDYRAWIYCIISLAHRSSQG